ncbi:MAG TPA: metalloregulator ArsR/SmtB family transcription factor [Gemmatimonadaceae bacterium]|nr:metalloregulator ArsR/SmtB family transcription factor [Gemmatimonadaceae bacterium]
MQTYQANAWAALGDPMRRAIVERIAKRPLPVGEIASKLPISRPAVSQHLKVLKDAGLVLERPIGTRRLYSLNPTGFEALRADLDRFWSRALSTYKQLVEQTTEEEP